MRRLLVIAIAVFALGFSHAVQAQESPSHLGKWKIVGVYATDSSGGVLTEESASVTADLVTNRTVEYEFTDSEFHLYIDGALSGSTHYTIAPSGLPDGSVDVTFDESGDDLSDIVRQLRGISVSETQLVVEARSPDVDSGIVYHESLERQP